MTAAWRWRGAESAGALACAAFVVAMLAAGAARAPAPTRADECTLELRGTAGEVAGQLVRADAAGVVLRVQRNGLDREEALPWSEIRAVQGLGGSGAAVDASTWLQAGEHLWRGRTRAMRGDWQLALEPLVKAAQAWRGGAPSADGLAASLGATTALLKAGMLAEALPLAYEAMRHVRAGMTPPEWATGGKLWIDAARAIPAAVPPMAVQGDAAAEAAQALRAFAAPDDPALENAARAYAALLDGAAPAQAKSAKLSDEGRQGAQFLALLRECGAETAAARSAARRNLSAMRRSLPPWADAWVRCALGSSLGMESDAPSRERGAILLLSVDATNRVQQPALAASARAGAAAILRALGDRAGAERLAEAEQPTDAEHAQP